MRVPRLLWFLALAGCDGCEPEVELPKVLSPISTDPVAIWAGQGEGVGAASVPFLVVNAVGASVPGDELGFTSSGAVTLGLVTPDATGWAYASLTGRAGAFDITANQALGTATGTGFLLDNATVRLGFTAWPSLDADGPVAPSGNGVVIAAESELWWYPKLGGAGIRVLALDDEIVEALPVQIDDDGVDDLVVWSDSTVVLLRGRSEGGLSFAAGWTAVSGTITSAFVADLDKDSIPDIVVAVNGEDSANAVWLSGSGQSAWEATADYEADFTVFGVTAEDYDLDGVAEITLLTEDGILRRYANLDGDWQAASQSDFTLSTAAGSRVFGGMDLTNDDWDDLLISGPTLEHDGFVAACASPGGTSQPVIYDLITTNDAVESVGSYVADGDGDGMLDIFISTPDTFERARWSTDAGTFSVMGFQGLPSAERFAISDINDDGLGDVIFPGAPARAVFATNDVDDPDTTDDESIPWKVDFSYTGVFDLALVGQPWTGDITGDGIVDVAALTTTGGLSLQIYAGVAEVGETGENIRSIGVDTISATATGLDLAVCGQNIWVLVSDAGEMAYHYSVDSDGSLALESSVAAPDSTMIVCGAFASSSAATIGNFGNITYLNDDGSTDTVSGTGDVGDAVAADLDGDDIAEVLTVPVGSTLAVGDLTGDGSDDSVSSDGVTTDFVLDGVASSLPFGGAVNVGDSDGDGIFDAIIHADGVIEIVRGLGGRVGIPSGLWLPIDTRGAAFVGDLDGNGLPDVFVLGNELDTSDSMDWTGTILYVEAADPGEPADDTTDTAGDSSASDSAAQ